MAVAVTAVVVVALAVGGVVAFAGSDDDDGGETTSSPSPSSSASSSPSASASSSASPDWTPTLDPSMFPTYPVPSVDISDLPTFSFDPDILDDLEDLTRSPEPSTDTSSIPYVSLKKGECFNTPSLTTGIDTIKKVSCNQRHDAEVIGTVALSGAFSSDKAVTTKATKLCQTQWNNAANRQGDGRSYYTYVLSPVLSTYDTGVRSASCSLTLSDKPGGKKLTAPLK
ncbi:hypothetical protein AQ490_17360 [Wenjunlia vitaminophila]|uniref:Septum formation-related domain-containing protein n=1 Tax=Wenjunlia vitaminophila TaxID=76728 RepID=A0A0T6LVY5_WENVI|nr:hypothetical protein AQ490_17360 [Wenjunlia vitaminophila]